MYTGNKTGTHYKVQIPEKMWMDLKWVAGCMADKRQLLTIILVYYT